MVERCNRCLETSFLPDRAFASPGDFADQLAEWLDTVGNQRRPRSLGGTTPAQVVVADRAAMTVLPPVTPSVGPHARVRLPRYYVVLFIARVHALGAVEYLRRNLVDLYAEVRGTPCSLWS